MNSTLIKTVFIGFSVMLYWACKKQIQCPPFSQDDLIYIPYQKGDTLIFKNQLDQQTLIFVIRNVELSDAYSYKCSDLNKICPCRASATVFATSSINPSDDFKLLEFEKFNSSTQKNHFFRLFDFEFEIDFKNFKQNIQYIDYARYYESLTIGNQEYTDVFEINNTTHPHSSVLTVFVNQSNGILRFSEKNHKIWTIVN